MIIVRLGVNEIMLCSNAFNKWKYCFKIIDERVLFYPLDLSLLGLNYLFDT